eukprot:6236087-Amphidinium_carterae.2
MTGKAASSCPVKEQQTTAKIVGASSSRNEISEHANQVLEQAKARQNRQPPIKGSPEHKKTLLKTKPPTKPPPGFPPGTAVPRGFDSEALKLALESLPKTASAQPVIANNGQVMIALVNQGDIPAPVSFDPRWHTPSTVISRSKCGFCATEDEPDRPLHLCWYEHPRQHKKCGARVACNIKPPSRSGLEDFPDCLWCKAHESIVLPHVKYKHRIGAREDWYFWILRHMFVQYEQRKQKIT